MSVGAVLPPAGPSSGRGSACPPACLGKAALVAAPGGQPRSGSGGRRALPLLQPSGPGENISMRSWPERKCRMKQGETWSCVYVGVL